MSDLLNPNRENFSEEELNIEEQFRPQSFNDFTGQAHILENLEILSKQLNLEEKLWIMFCFMDHRV